jgi:hypothetical protein
MKEKEMSVDREALKNFLNDNGCQDFEGALASLEKLFQIAESGQYSLAPVEEIYREALIEAVISATSRSVSKVVFISLSNTFPKPEWMTQEAYETSFRDSLGDSFGVSLGDSLWTILRFRLGAILGDSLGISLGISLVDSLVDSLGDSLGDSFGVSLGVSLMDSIFYYLGFCLLNDQQQIAKLRPLVELWSKCLILGFKQDEPETLLVICK